MLGFWFVHRVGIDTAERVELGFRASRHSGTSAKSSEFLSKVVGVHFTLMKVLIDNTRDWLITVISTEGGGNERNVVTNEPGMNLDWKHFSYHKNLSSSKVGQCQRIVENSTRSTAFSVAQKSFNDAFTSDGAVSKPKMISCHNRQWVFALHFMVERVLPKPRALVRQITFVPLRNRIFDWKIGSEIGIFRSIIRRWRLSAANDDGVGVANQFVAIAICLRV